MNTERWKRLERALDELLDADEGDRPALLDRLAGGDAGFGHELADLLDAERDSRDWLPGPIESFAPALLSSVSGNRTDQAHAELAGRRLGPYRLLHEIGRGGMGTVFLAERADGQFEQRVALKLVRADLRGASARRRFLEERRLLARLSHPGIARLLDGGVTDDGAPYLVLEYVEGLQLLDDARRNARGLDQRLGLFLQICRAVEHAHRSLVVHRDLKPGNVLVTHDGQVKLLDFGIAKLLSDGAEAPAVGRTRVEDRVLTPEYAAPELLLGGTVTTATDVYSLGALLYELLTARRPLELEAASLLELERSLRDDRPRPPSRAAAASQGPEVAFARWLKGDLDAVMLKALEKRPEDRYVSVAELAEDLERARAFLPVRARRLGAARRAARFVRRHRLGVAVAAAALALVALGVASTLWQARRALREAERVRQVKDFTLGLFESSDPDVAGGDRLTAEQILDRGLERIDRDLAGQPALQADMLEVVGDVLVKLGRYPEARGPFERAVALRRGGERPDPAALARALVRLGDAAHFEFDLDRAEALYREAEGIQARALGEDHRDLLASRGLLARVALDRGKFEAARRQLEPLLATATRALGSDDALAIETETALAESLLATGDLVAAEWHFGHVLEIRRRTLGAVHSEVSVAAANHAAALEALGRLEEAERSYREALSVDRRLFGADHPELAPGLNNLASVLVRRGRCVEAVELAAEAVRIKRAQHGEGHSELAPFLHNLGKAWRCAGRATEAIPLAREATALARSAFGEDHELAAISQLGLALALADDGRVAEAEPLLRDALRALSTRLAPEDPRRLEAVVGLARLLRRGGDAAAAETLLGPALAHLRGRFGDTDLRTGEAALELGMARSALGRTEEGRAALELARAAIGPELPAHDRRRRELEAAASD